MSAHAHMLAMVETQGRRSRACGAGQPGLLTWHVSIIAKDPSSVATASTEPAPTGHGSGSQPMHCAPPMRAEQTWGRRSRHSAGSLSAWGRWPDPGCTGCSGGHAQAGFTRGVHTHAAQHLRARATASCRGVRPRRRAAAGLRAGPRTCGDATPRRSRPPLSTSTTPKAPPSNSTARRARTCTSSPAPPEGCSSGQGGGAARIARGAPRPGSGGGRGGR